MSAASPTIFLILRGLCGVWFLPHVVGKLRNRHAAAQTFDRVGLRPGSFYVLVTAGMEILASIGLLLNLYPVVAATLAVLVLVGASLAVIKLNGANWRWQKQGPEYMIFWSLVCILSVWPLVMPP